MALRAYLCEKIRGALLRSFKESRTSLEVNFLIASGYTGQTTETLALPSEAVPVKLVVGCALEVPRQLELDLLFQEMKVFLQLGGSRIQSAFSSLHGRST